MVSTVRSSSASGTTSDTRPQGERVGGGDPLPAHDDILRAAEAGQPRETLRASRAGNHPEADLRQAERAVSVATRKSQARASSSPTPRQ